MSVLLDQKARECMKAIITVILGSVIFASGCTTMPGGKTVLGAPGSAAWFYSTTNQEKTEYIEKTCERYGYKKGANNWPECIERVSKKLNLTPGFD